MKKLLITLLCICCICGLNKAKAQFLREKDYRVIVTNDYMNIEGSPYLYDDWVAGNVKLANGTTNKEPMQIKYNLITDELSFKDKTGEEMAFVVPVSEFTMSVMVDGKLSDKHYRSGYTSVDGSKPTAYFEVLSDGTVQLLKRVSKIILERQDYGSASKTKSFQDKTNYYLLINGKAIAIKNDKKSLLNNLSDKQPALDEFIKTNKINFKADADLGKLVNYYNTL